MPVSRIEHVAFNVADPVAVAGWYVANLGMRIVRGSDAPPYIHFLADARGTSLIELYGNPAAAVPDYAGMNPLTLHLAFEAADPEATKADLVAAGATFVNETHLPDGSHIVMLRDPWGFSIQLCKRGTPLV